MASNISSELEDVVGKAPADLVEYFETGKFLRDEASGVNMLGFAEAMNYTRDIHGVAVARRMGLVALEDANNSDPYCYITQGCCSGAIILFSHDREPEIRFKSLASFLRALPSIIASGEQIDELSPEADLWLDTSSELSSFVIENTVGATFLICTLLPVTRELDSAIKQKLCNHEDFFVREAFATRIAKLPKPDDLSHAAVLAVDKHPQVQAVGKRALSAVRKANHQRS